MRELWVARRYSVRRLWIMVRLLLQGLFVRRLVHRGEDGFRLVVLADIPVALFGEAPVFVFELLYKLSGGFGRLKFCIIMPAQLEVDELVGLAALPVIELRQEV